MSPDGESIVTGAGDETLRFWNVFSKTRSTKVRLEYRMVEVGVAPAVVMIISLLKEEIHFGIRIPMHGENDMVLFAFRQLKPEGECSFG